MKGSLLLLTCFLIGILFGIFAPGSEAIVSGNTALYVLYALLTLVGIGIGCDSKSLQNLLQMNVQAFLVPISCALGSILGAAFISLFLGKILFWDSMAVGAGFGYYSLSSILITQIKGSELGIVALLSNIFREVFTIIFTPLLAKYLGPLAPIACGGATTMDTTLPVIHKEVGTQYTIIAVINGIALSMAVPFLVPFLLTNP